MHCGLWHTSFPVSDVSGLVVLRRAGASECLRRPLGRRRSAVVEKIRGLARGWVSPPPGRGKPTRL